jgi:Stage II sporulation protein E (SpoIIE)
MGSSVQRAGSWRRTLLRRARSAQRITAIALMAVAIGLGAVRVGVTEQIPVLSQIIPLLAGGLLLTFRWLVALTVVCLLVAGYTLALLPASSPKIGAFIVLGATAWIVLTGARVRSRLGVLGSRGETILIELREVLALQGELPALPAGWRAESEIRSAGGSSFSGDFVVSVMSQRETVLEIALVDVSGKGLDAGSRALLLSGAFGGLLGVVPSAEFLRAANEYLRRQKWEDDFATVVHVAINLVSGDYQVRTAGHPPAIHFDAWSGRWQTRETEGPLLGLMEQPEYVENTGQLKQGDALLLYSDGMVETRKRDIRLGIDKLVGQAERMVAREFEGAAKQLVDEVGGGHDDAALVLIHREMHPPATSGDKQTTSRSWVPVSLRRHRGMNRSERPKELTP